MPTRYMPEPLSAGICAFVFHDVVSRQIRRGEQEDKGLDPQALTTTNGQAVSPRLGHYLLRVQKLRIITRSSAKRRHQESMLYLLALCSYNRERTSANWPVPEGSNSFLLYR